MVYSEFNNAHLKAFQESLSDELDPNEARGKRWKPFADGLYCEVSSDLPEGKLKRDYIFTLAETENVNIATVCAAIMAWGNMHYNHRNLLFNPKNEDWLSIASDIRCGGLNRAKAYDSFAKLRELREMKGAGPAYFTKLIYFLMPRSSTATKFGYIMDQWAGCSINLLTGSEIVLMDAQKTWKLNNRGFSETYLFTASDKNSGANYEKFCKKVESLANYFRIDDRDVDRALFSSGGIHPKIWREYVTENRPKLNFNDAK